MKKSLNMDHLGSNISRIPLAEYNVFSQYGKLMIAIVALATSCVVLAQQVAQCFQGIHTRCLYYSFSLATVKSIVIVTS